MPMALTIPEEKPSMVLICDKADCIEFDAISHPVFSIMPTAQLLWTSELKWHIAKLANAKEAMIIRVSEILIGSLIFMISNI